MTCAVGLIRCREPVCVAIVGVKSWPACPRSAQGGETEGTADSFEKLTYWFWLCRISLGKPQCWSFPCRLYGLQANLVGSLGSTPKFAAVASPVGLEQSGPRLFGATGSEIIASGPA